MDVLKEIQQAEERSKEYTEKSHMAISKTVSNLGGDIKLALEKLSNLVQSSAIEHINLKHALETIAKNTDETIIKLHKLEVEVRNLEKETANRDSNLEKLIQANDQKLRAWVWRTMFIVTLAGSFVWIKESRDLILSVIKVIL